MNLPIIRACFNKLPAVVVCALLSSPINALAELRIAHNQLGFFPTAHKSALVLSKSASGPVAWKLTGRVGDISGTTSNFVFEPLAKTWVAEIDFSEQQSVGNYTLKVGTAAAEVVIADTVYDDLLNKLLRSFYLQRCGVALNDSLNNLTHQVCHADDGIVAYSGDRETGLSHPAPGGWHDAGDYGKYVSTTAVVLVELFSLYEANTPLLANLDLAIPESDNTLPDVLDEMKVGLDWMLLMQRKDGALYRKLSGASWPKLVPPEEDLQPRYLYGVATDDTAKAVAAFAMGARIFATHDPAYAKRLLKAAVKGWKYLVKHPDFFIDFKETDNKGSGPYMANDIDKEHSLTHDRDDRLLAAVQLYTTTGSRRYLRTALKLLPEAEINLYEWKDASLHGVLDFIHHQQNNHPQLSQSLAQRVMQRAQAALSNAAANQFGVANTRFVWGSNKMAAQEGNLMMAAYDMSGERRFLDSAQVQLDYLLGRNAFQQSFVSEIGTNSVANLHHIFRRANDLKLPGFMVGGPNNGAQANIAPKDQNFLSYADHDKSYATNEYAIDYNSALIHLVTVLKTATPDS